MLVPNTLEDFKLILDNNGIMNKTAAFNVISSDNFVITDAGFQVLSQIERSAYLWEMENSVFGTSTDWNSAYQQVFYANVVLDGLNKIVRDESNKMQYDELKGEALFYRSYAFFTLLQVYAAPYDPESADQIKGIPIKLESDVNVKAKLENLKDCYEQVATDLITAEQLLPRVQQISTRPSATAALALLGRLCLVTQNFIDGEKYTLKVLNEYAELLDYNSLDTSAARPFPSVHPIGTGNVEILFYSPFHNLSFLSISNREVTIVTELYDQYETEDLRKYLFFMERGEGVINFKGSYSGSRQATMFSGLTTAEAYLTAAECLARNNKPELAMEYLNRLLESRYVTGEFHPIQTGDSEGALAIILEERRKELLARGTRWTDLRRLNQEGLFNTIIKRTVSGEEYILDVKQSRYFYPFPESEGLN